MNSQALRGIVRTLLAAFSVATFTSAAQPYFLDTTLAPTPNLFPLSSIAISSDNKILVGGAFASDSGLYRAIVRLDDTGKVDPTFHSGRDLTEAGSIAVFADGSVGAVALYDNLDPVVVKLASDGTMLWNVLAKNVPGNWLESPLLALPDGNLLVGGLFTNIADVARQSLALLGTNGVPMPAFNLAFNGAVTALARTTNGLIYVGGSFTTVAGVARKHMVRLTADGAVDPAFDPGDIVSVSVSSLAIQRDGKILLAGVLNTDNGGTVKRLLRLLPDGSVDPQFQIGAGPDDAPKRIVIDSQDRIILGGAFNNITGVDISEELFRPRLARLLPTGAVDPAFNLQGGPNSAVRDVAIDTQGRYVIAGAFNRIGPRTQKYLARFLPEELGPTVDFQINRFETAEDNVEISIPLNRFGSSENFITVEISTNPTNETSEFPPFQRTIEFAPNELSKNVTIPLTDDGQVEGDETLQIRCRIISGGTPVEHTAEILVHDDEIPVFFEKTINSPLYRFSPLVLAEANGVLALGGGISSSGPAYIPAFNGVAISRMDGTPEIVLEAQTAPYGGQGYVFSLAWGPDNKVVVGGRFDLLGNYAVTNLARLNANGTLDPSFKPVSIAPVTSLLVRPDGKTLAVGEFVRAGTTSILAQLTASGEVDPTFEAPAFFTPRRMALQADGKLLVSGAPWGLTRLLTNGSLDPFFRPFPTQVESITPTTNGQIYIAGNFTIVHGVHRPGVARLNNDGSLDLSFNPQIPPGLNTLETVALRPDGKILFGGWNQTLRLNPDGSIDPTLKLYADFNWRINSLPLSDGRVLVFGNPNYIELSGTYSFLAQTNATLSKVIVENPEISLHESDQAQIHLRRIGDISNFLFAFNQVTNGTNFISDDLEIPFSIFFDPLRETTTLDLKALHDELIESDETFRMQIQKATTGSSVISEPAYITVLDTNGRPGSLSYIDGVPPRQWSSGIAATADGSVLIAGSGYDPITLLRADGSITNITLPYPFEVWQNVVITAYSNVFYLAGNFVPDRFNPDLKLGALYRILPDGRIDSTFKTTALRMTPKSIAVEPDGKIVVAGSWIYPSLVTLMRFSPDGTELGSWAFAYQINQIAALPNGNILYNPGGYVAFYNLNGGGQTNFNSIAPLGDNVSSIVPDGDSFYVTGKFTNVNQLNALYRRTGIVRALPGGQIDPNFTPEIFPANIYAVAIDNQHRILISGEFQTVNGIPRPNLARLLPDGTLDLSFEPGGGVSAPGAQNQIHTIAASGNGELFVLANDYTQPSSPFTLARLAPDLPFAMAFHYYSVNKAPQISINTIPGQSYKVESSSNLQDWTLAAQTNATGHQIWIPAPVAPIFFRAATTNQ